MRLMFASALAGMLCIGNAIADETVRFVIHDRTLHRVDPRLFGQFMERPSWGETGPEAALVPGTNALQLSVLKLLKEMKIPILRFPGGTDVDFLDWRDMVSNVPGRSPERPISKGHLGHEVTNRFGYDEFLQLCEQLGAEAILVVNFRDGLLGKRPLKEAAQRAAELVAYCNAPVGAKLPAGMPDWPSIRAKNGRKKPYGVKYWQIGNETWFFLDNDMSSMSLEERTKRYVECLAAYVKAMREVDPSIRFIIDGLGSTKKTADLARKELGDAISHFALHCYMPWAIREIKKEDGSVVPFDKLTQEEIWNTWVAMPGMDASGLAHFEMWEIDAARQEGVKLAMTEWNWNGWWHIVEGGPHPPLDSCWAKGIGAAGFLHALMRAGDVIEIGCQSMLVGARWGITAIRSDPTGKIHAYYMPTGQITAFYRRHHGDRLLELHSSGVPTYEQPYQMSGIRPYKRVALIDALATRSDRSIFFHAINRSFNRAIDVEIDLSNFGAISAKATHHLIEGRLNDHPREGEPRQVARESSRALTINGSILKVTLPARSVNCVEVDILGKTLAFPPTPDRQVIDPPLSY